MWSVQQLTFKAEAAVGNGDGTQSVGLSTRTLRNSQYAQPTLVSMANQPNLEVDGAVVGVSHNAHKRSTVVSHVACLLVCTFHMCQFDPRHRHLPRACLSSISCVEAVSVCGWRQTSPDANARNLRNGRCGGPDRKGKLQPRSPHPRGQPPFPYASTVGNLYD